MTTLTSMLKPKLVCQVIVMTENNITNYICFNDGFNSFLRKIDKDLSISNMPTKTTRIKIWTTNHDS